MDDRHPEDETRETEALARALKRVYRGRVDVPSEVDEAMRARAALPFARIRRRRLLWLVVPAAAAATVALAFYLGSVGTESASPAPNVALHTPPPPTDPVPVAPDAGRRLRAEDFNRDGRVDIRDALALARRLRTGGLAADEWDLSGDGIVDRADVDRIARAVVAVGGGGP